MDRERERPVRPASSHEEEVPCLRRGAVGERDGLGVGVDAGEDLPLVGAGRGEARTLRHGAKAAEHQDIALVAIEIVNGRAVGAAGRKHEHVVAVVANQGIRTERDQCVGAA